MKVWGFFMLCWIHNCKCQHFFVYCGMNKKYQKYIDYIAKDIQVPYIEYLDAYGLRPEEYELVLPKVFNQPVRIKDRFETYYVFNKEGNIIYYEQNDGYWVKQEYDNQGNIIYYENSDGYWQKWEYDDQGNITYNEDSDGCWSKREYDDQGNMIYREDSDGYILDRR